MSVYAGPEITDNGLVLSLDAGNAKSYVGSGTIWSDLSGNDNSATLSGPTYNTTAGGNFAFDGVNDYADFYAPNLGSTATVEMWAFVNSTQPTSTYMYFGWLMYDVYWAPLYGMGFNTGAGDIYGISQSTASSLGLVGNWKHYVFEMRSDVSYVNNKLYINGDQKTLTQILGSQSTANRNFNSGFGRIGIWKQNADLNYYMSMNCPIFKVYNRSLTSAEIQQNFNALRGRFDI